MAAALTTPLLARHLPDPIVVVDAGCRWGFAPQWEALVPHILLWGIDTDEHEIARLAEERASRPHMHFAAAALGAATGEAVLHRTREPAASSLYRPTRGSATHLAPWEGGTVESTVSIELTTLDTWALDLSVDRVDALKLDTQGAELEILRGAPRVLSDVRYVEVEVAFNEIGEGAPLFGEVDAFLRSHGFALWRLRDLVSYGLAEALDPPLTTEYFWYESTPYDLDLPGGQLTWCNAHYVRRDMYAQGRLDWISRIRDACIADVNGFHDLAILALKRLLNEPCPTGVREEAEWALRMTSPPTDGDGTSANEQGIGRLRRLMQRTRQ